MHSARGSGWGSQDARQDHRNDGSRRRKDPLGTGACRGASTIDGHQEPRGEERARAGGYAPEKPNSSCLPNWPAFAEAPCATEAAANAVPVATLVSSSRRDWPASEPGALKAGPAAKMASMVAEDVNLRMRPLSLNLESAVGFRHIAPHRITTQKVWASKLSNSVTQ